MKRRAQVLAGPCCSLSGTSLCHLSATWISPSAEGAAELQPPKLSQDSRALANTLHQGGLGLRKGFNVCRVPGGFETEVGGQRLPRRWRSAAWPGKHPALDK